MDLKKVNSSMVYAIGYDSKSKTLEVVGDKVPNTMTKKRTRMKDYFGTWRITEMDQWDMDYIDMVSPGRIVIDKYGQGKIHFGAVDVEIDCRLEPHGKRVRLGFSFEGNDECDPVSGRGWALVEGEEMTGRIFFHLGDDSEFKAKRQIMRKGSLW